MCRAEAAAAAAAAAAGYPGPVRGGPEGDMYRAAAVSLFCLFRAFMLLLLL